MFTLKLSKVGFPGGVLPQVTFLKGHLWNHWNFMENPVETF